MSNELETQILFAIYHLYKTDQITEAQRGELKDMLIQKDQSILSLKSQDQLAERLLLLLNGSETSSNVSYKNSRPAKLMINNRYLKDISTSINNEQRGQFTKKTRALTSDQP